MTRTFDTLGRFARTWGVMLAMVLSLLSPQAFAQDFPILSGRVVDAAGMMTRAQAEALQARLAAHEASSTDQVVVATVPNLQGYEIADFANRLARHWGIGQQGENNGVLLLVARDERQVRIEVGYGLEGTLTDALSRIVIENDILPRFRSSDFAGGIAAGADAIVSILSGNADEVRARAERNAGWSGEGVDDWISLAVVLFILATAFGPVALMLLARIFGTKLPGGRRRFMGMEFGGRSGRRRRGNAGYWGGGMAGGGLGGGWGGGSSGGGFSGGGGSFGGGGASGSW
ncbi:TPM domain-containing protein [Aureimonas sp. OT7]|uniref:TPM domain-containing protein n=1 Tax=Aureimonas TaxID=414371 RepID=UPI0017844A6A|nr:MULTISPECIES: TPM domain-containing protein [Aureimonas]QOG06956.1 TPM domain-containing protein [Aureimonas sp. OT7]